MSVARTRSLRRQLLAGILLPLLLIVAFNTWSLYREALGALNTAYDRTLLASAKSLGEWLDIQGEGDAARLQANVPSAALEAFEADLQSRMAYRLRRKLAGTGLELVTLRGLGYLLWAAA